MTAVEIDAVDTETITTFLSALYADVDEGVIPLTWWHRDRGPLTTWAASGSLLAEQAVDLPAGSSVYYPVATRRRVLGGGARGGARECLNLLALVCDIDVAGPAHQIADLPPTIEAALALLADFALRPTVTVHSGHGIQGVWMLAEPVPVAEADEVRRRFGATWTALAARRGWKVDNVASAEHIFRLPGTINSKLEPWAPVTIIESCWSRRYGIDDIEEHSVDLPAPPRPPREPSAGNGSGIPLGPKSPIEVYNASTKPGELMAADGCVYRYSSPDGSEQWSAPHHADDGATGITIYNDADRQRAVIRSAGYAAHLGVEQGRSMDAFDLFAHLHHGGDVEVALAALAAADGPAAGGESGAPDAGDGDGDGDGDGEEPTAPGADAKPDHIMFRTIPDPFVVPALQWHAHGLLARPTHGEMAGPEKSLKSYVGTAIDVALAAGLDVLGRWRVDHQQRVLVLIGEGGELGFLRRLERICAGYGVTIDDVRPWLRFTTQTAPTSSPRFIDGVQAALDDFQPELVHLDPWYAYAPAGVDARNLYEQGAALERVGGLVRDGGASLILNNHFNQTGTGNGLRRISMAGHAEWCDSWMLLDHRTPPDVGNGRFRLKLDIGSRQWGGGSFHLDFDIGRFNIDTNDHEGRIGWRVTTATDGEASESADDRKAADTRVEIVKAWTKRRDHKQTPWSREDWLTRVTFKVSATLKRAAFAQLLDDGRIAGHDVDVVDRTGRTQKKIHYGLVRSTFEGAGS